ncbi:hypothetical protein BIW11_10927 [Tropilaelaps mercedesae]|uniref:LIM and SH3 domain protein Lasp n=1 Tax=Tropilaelaps mercedesae TaxID=418985 RepID=A0A1V9XDV3_9ACAR|nr:hypothetical protein BIW11_10927 [Tropilaelaps mercedesae]
MGNKKCARCLKTVYPIEELKCLDKVWHKQCFKCQECGMTLSMNTYKGYDRLPYCNAHVPHATYTTVPDTPEARRLAENTKLQSNVKYHEEYEKSKGRVIQVADDPEILRLSQQTKIISDVAYHGDVKKTDATRVMLNGDIGPSTHRLDSLYEPLDSQGSTARTKLYELYGTSNLSIPKYQIDDSALTFGPRFNAASLGDYEIYSPTGSLRRTKSCKVSSGNYKLKSYNSPTAHQPPSPTPTAYGAQPTYSQQSSYQDAPRPILQSQSSQGGGAEPHSPLLPFEDDRMPRPGQSQFAAALNALKRNAPPQSFGFSSSPQQPLQEEQMRPSSQPISLQQNRYEQLPATAGSPQDHLRSYQTPQHQANTCQRPQPSYIFQGLQQQQQQQPPHYQSPSQTGQQLQYQKPYKANLQRQASYTQPNSAPTPASPQQSIAASKFRPSAQHGRCFVALYDYMAGDIDEVTFCEGDVIVNGEPIEGGWMIGTVLRNGQRGLLPANYVQVTA